MEKYGISPEVSIENESQNIQRTVFFPWAIVSNSKKSVLVSLTKRNLGDNKIEKIGKLVDVLKVKDGFARNYLLPQNKALRANKENLSIYEKEKEKYEKLNKDKLSAAEKIAKNMQDVSINIIKQASDSGQLYGSVSTRDISDELNNQGHKIEKKQIVLKSVIKTVGQHEVRVVIHPEHIINIKVNI